MSNIPEKENINELEPQDITPEEEDSTVFSAPLEHKKKAENVRRNRLLPKILLSVLAVAILVGGTYAIIKLIPEKVKKESIPTVMEDVQVLNYTTEDVSYLKVKNANGEFEFSREMVKTTDSETGAEKEIEGNWYLKGYDKEQIDPEMSSFPISKAVQIYAIRNITQKSFADCGLDNPAVEVFMTTKKDGDITILIGAASPDQTGYYVKLSTSEEIYLVANDFYTAFDFDALDFATADPLPTFEISDEEIKNQYFDTSGNLISFDKMTISGVNFTEPVVMTGNPDEKFSSFATYLITSPTDRIAETESIDTVFAIFQSAVSTYGAYSFDTSKASQAQFGLDNPDIKVKIEVNGETMTYSFKLQEDECYAVVHDKSTVISRMLASNIGFADYTEKDFYSSWIALVSIDDIDSLVIKNGEKVYDFGITTTEPAEGETKNTYTITYNGATISTPDFQTFYQECVSVACTDFVFENVSEKPSFTMTFNYKDSDEKYTVDFIKTSETRYQYRINGIDMGKVNSSNIKKIVTMLEELVAN